MKRKRMLLIGLILGALGGWVIGYLRVPDIPNDHSFWLGFGLGLMLLLVLLGFLFIGRKHAGQLDLMTDATTNSKRNGIRRTFKVMGIFAVVFIVIIALLSSFLIFRQTHILKTDLAEQNKQIEQQSELIKSLRSSNQGILMSNVLDKVDEELISLPNRILSESTIDRIASLSYSLKPYRYFEGDSLTAKLYSPERAQLLLALTNMNIDSSSINKIKFKTSFSCADLRGADLYRADLSRANLKGADFREAKLRYANFENADLRDVRFWGADLTKADFDKANLRRADFSWANLNGADLSDADMTGTKLISSNLKKANLSDVNWRWSKLDGILLIEANMKEADLAGSSLVKANLQKAILVNVDLRYTDLSRVDFSGANLKNADLKSTNLSLANLSGANLEGVEIDDKDWFTTLENWSVLGLEEIVANYKIVEITPGKSIFRLEKIIDK